jgi:ketosteroid isomerase-like protein
MAKSSGFEYEQRKLLAANDTAPTAFKHREITVTLTRSRVREIYDDFANARFDRLLEVMDDKIDFISHAPPDVFPYLGRRRGRAEVIQALSEVHKRLEVLSFWPITTVVDDDHAALTVVITVRDRATQNSASFLAAHFLRFNNDRIVDYRAIIDSLDAVRQLREPEISKDET